MQEQRSPPNLFFFSSSLVLALLLELLCHPSSAFLHIFSCCRSFLQKFSHPFLSVLLQILCFLSKTLSHHQIQFSLLQTFAFPSDICEVPPHFESMGRYVRTMSAFDLVAFRFSYKRFLWELGAELLQLLTLLQYA